MTSLLEVAQYWAMLYRQDKLDGKSLSGHQNSVLALSDEVARLEKERDSILDTAVPGLAKLVAEMRERLAGYAVNLTKRDREIAILRQYGNKDCTAMADEALARGE